MSGPFGSSGFGGGGDGADNLEYSAKLRKYFDDLEQQQKQRQAEQLSSAADQLFGGLMMPADPTTAGQANANGWVDPRNNPALQSMLRSLHDALQSGNPELQRAALNSMGRVTDGLIPNAPNFRDELNAMRTNDTRNFEYAKANGFQGNFVDWLKFDNESKRPQPGVQFEGEYDKTLGRAQAEELLQFQQAPMKRAALLDSMQAIHGLLGDRGGFQGSNLQELKMAAERLGVQIDGLGNDQAAAALANAVALQLRSTGAGGGMPGALSDADRAFLQKQVPSIDMTPQGRAQLLEVQRRLLKREGEVADLARAYAGQNGGRLDYRFYDQLVQLRDQSLFDDINRVGADVKIPPGASRLRRIN